MKNILLPLLFAMYCTHLFSEDSIGYTYDTAGNRTTRKITLVTLRSANAAPIDSSQVDSELGDLKVTIFPNPTRGTIWVGLNNYKSATNVKLMLYSPEGKPLKTITSQEDRTPIDLSEYPIGGYLLHVIVGDKKFDFKIIKQ